MKIILTVEYECELNQMPRGLKNAIQRRIGDLNSIITISEEKVLYRFSELPKKAKTRIYNNHVNTNKAFIRAILSTLWFDKKGNVFLKQ